jgi:SAM-dependent methyltransferase
MTTATAPLNQSAVDAFAGRMLAAFNEAGLLLMTSIGHRTGLFDAFARVDAPVTSHQLAAAANLSERYVREWLGCMLTAGVVRHDPAAKTYSLPPEHAACLTRAASPNNLAGTAQWVAVLGHVEDKVVDAFRHGRGVPYSAYHRFHEVMAEESAQTVVAALHNHIIPLAPGLSDRLASGIDVLDVGCGAGQALAELAAAYPNSRFTGYDLSPEAVATGQSNARLQGLTNLRFEARDVAQPFTPQSFDLITGFDAIHDQAKPAQVLANIHGALRAGALFLMQDIGCSSHHHRDVDHPLGPFIYAISCMHCMSVSLANGGPGLGAAWGKTLALSMLADAGFRNVDVHSLPHDPMNFYYLAPRT